MNIPPVVLDSRNAWLWQASETHWVFKKTGDGSSWRHIAPCMDPYFEGRISPATAARQARAFKAAGVNLVATESLRRIMRFEAEGKTEAVIAAIRMATEACHRQGMKILHHTTASFVDQTRFPATPCDVMPSCISGAKHHACRVSTDLETV